MSAIVVGSARCVWDDLDKIPKAVREQATWYAVNDMIMYSPVVHHGVSHHPAKLPHWAALRMADGHDKNRSARVITHASKAMDGIDHAWPKFRYGGSSSLLAARIAIEMGHGHVILAGVPLDRSGNIFNDHRLVAPYDYLHFRQAWVDVAASIKANVFVISGYLLSVLQEYKP